MKPSDLVVNILGCGSATPTTRHLPSCQVLEYRGQLYMIDCGEGAQLAMRRQGLSFARLRHIFISHLHGDHCLGLIPLLSTLALHDRGGAITIHMHPSGIPLFRQMHAFFCHDTPYEIRWEPLPERGTLLDTGTLRVSTFPLRHRVPCNGFRLDTPGTPRHLLPEMLQYYNVPVRMRASLREGADYTTDEGVVIPNSRLTRPGDPALSYAYCSDTVPTPAVAEACRGVTLMYHEATYADDNAEMAAPRGHSTARQAGTVAARAHASALLIGHYSKRYRTTADMVAQAHEAFGGTVIAAEEGMRIAVTADGVKVLSA